MPRLLLVEDEQVNRDLFRRRLERKGYSVIPAENGLSAVALAKTEHPDLVVMDLGLPDMDGWEATRRIKTDPATAAIPVLVLSAHATRDAREKAFAAGCEEFETKPVDWESLFKKIEEALERAKARAATPAPPSPAPPSATDDTIDLGAEPVATPDPTALTAVRRAPKTDTARRPVLQIPPTVEEKDVCTVHPKHILVVEDNDANRVMLCRRLNKHGYATTEAADGRQALAALAGRRFDLVLCDIMMPGVDGFEVLRAMKADPELVAIPVIMISAVDEMESIVRCIEMGAEDYLQKPYEPVLLYARVHACLDKRRLRDQEAEYLAAVTALTRAAERVEQGTFDPALLSAVAERDDALGTLARVFANMAYQVQVREQQLRDAAHRSAKDEPPPKAGAETMILPVPPPRGG